MIAYVVVACLVPNNLRQAVHIKKSPPFVQALVSESFAGLLDPSPAARSAEEDPGDVMGPVKSVTEQLNDSATVVKLSYQSTAPLSSL